MEENKKNENIENPQKKEKPFFLKHLWDFVVLAGLVAATSSFYVIRAIQSAAVPENATLTAVVTFEKTELGRYNLSDVTEYYEEVVHGKYTDLTLGIKHNAIAVIESGCPGQECVHQHWISEPNHPIICAYNLVYVDIISTAPSDEVITG